MSKRLCAAAAALVLICGQAWAQDPTGDEDAKQRAFLDSLHYQSGEITLDKAKAHLHLQPGFRYLDHGDARRVLEDYWGNPPDDEVLGLLVPDDAPLDSEHSWAVVLTYSDEGYVSDEDAAKIDYGQMLKDMQQQTLDANEERKNEHYPTMQLTGWAQPPHYDAARKKLYWAKEFAVEGADQHTLNYDIRVLGREGYLSMNAVAGVNDLAQVNDGMAQVLPMAEFDDGHRYADYKPGTDKLAAYGLAALIGGGLAAKAGLFAKLGVLLLAMKKFVIIAFVAVAGFLKKLFGKKSGTVQ